MLLENIVPNVFKKKTKKVKKDSTLSGAPARGFGGIGYWFAHNDHNDSGSGGGDGGGDGGGGGGD